MSDRGAFARSVIGRKIAMAVSGVLLVGFLLSHMASNILVFVDPAALDRYAAWLRGFGPLLWVARLGLLGLAVVHVGSAVSLIRLNRQARPIGYARVTRDASTVAARTMVLGGLLLLVFIVFHLLHLTTGTVHPDFVPGRVGENLVQGFVQEPGVAVFYAVAMVALGLHLAHGVWSAFQTLGLNHPRWNRARLAVAWALAVVIAGGLLVIPIGVLAGWADR